jgi:hypothetical protein
VGAGHAEAAIDGALEDDGQRSARRRVVAEALRASPDGVSAVEVAAEDDVQAGAARPAGLLGKLEAQAVEADGVVLADDAGLFHAEQLIEINIPQRDERGGGSAGGRVKVAL